MARVKIGNVKPVKGVDYFTEADRAEMVLNTPQTLTEEQKEQARGNIGVMAHRAMPNDGGYNVRAVNHRGYCTIAPENTIPAFILSKEYGFNYVECDVNFTVDGTAVLLHDDTIDRTSNGTGNVSAMTYNELLAYDFGSWKSEEYAGTKIPTFTEFIKTCRGLGLHPYIELKNGTEAQIAGLVNTVKAFGMNGKVTYISFSANCLSYVKKADPSARLGYVVDNITSNIIQLAIDLQTSLNEVFIDVNYTSLTEDAANMCIDAGLALEVWTVDTEAEIVALHPYVSGVTSNRIVAGKVLEKKYSRSVARQWAKNGSADITAELMSPAGIQDEYPYHWDNPNRVSYIGMDLTVSAGDVISISFEGNTTEVQWGIRTIYDTTYAHAVAGESLKPNPPGDGGWISGDYTIPVNSKNPVAIWITFAQKVDSEIPLYAKEMGTVTVTKKKGGS